MICSYIVTALLQQSGLMCIEIFGYKHESTKDFAVNLGIALQLTNILRDIKKDARGRSYLSSQRRPQTI